MAHIVTPALKPHILVVDDDDRLRELLGLFLSENGFLVSTADGAAAARSKLATLVYDLMVLDIMMPGETGLELAFSLRNNPQNRIRAMQSCCLPLVGRPQTVSGGWRQVPMIILLSRLSRVSCSCGLMRFYGVFLNKARQWLL